MSALSARHLWCAERILFCFSKLSGDKENNNDQCNESIVQQFLRKPAVQDKFDDLFSGKGPAVIFVHYQRMHLNELDSLDRKGRNNPNETKNPELFVSYGDSVLMNSKCCYFLRNSSQVDSSVANDTSLFYGEISDSPLETFKTMLSFTYAPLFAESSEWGETNEEQKADFKDEMYKFMHNLTSSVESIEGGLELNHLSSSHVESLDPSNELSFADHPEAIAHLVEMLEQWCGQIAKFLATCEKSSQKHESTANDVEGPRDEIEYWRSRTQHLSSIIEQFKRKDCRFAVVILSSFAKGANEPEKSNSISLIRRWKQIDIETTETFNEARDNLKYLSTLQRFIEPLYSGTAQGINDSLPALINAIKVSQQLCTYPRPLCIYANTCYSHLSHSSFIVADDFYHISVLQHSREGCEFARKDRRSDSHPMQGNYQGWARK